MSALHAGFAAVSITPPPGGWLNGFIARLHPSTGIDTPLQARALRLQQRDRCCLLIALDLLGLSSATADALVQRAAEVAGCPTSCVIVCCTHTHSGPMTMPIRGVGDADAAYLAWLEQRVLQAVSAARSSAAPAQASWGQAPLIMGVNRRESTPRGIVLGHNPQGPRDQAVRVLALHGSARPILVMIHACHPYILGGDQALISGDFCAHATAALDAQGIDAMFVNGCCGDLAPQRAFQGPAAAQQEGQRLAEAALQALHVAQRQDDAALWAGSLTTALPHAPLPALAELARQLHDADHTVRDSERADPRVVQRVHAAWSQWLDDLPRHLPLPPVPARLSLLRLGRGAIAMLPGEIFFDTGADLARQLPAQPACVAAYAHGYIGYVPTPQAHAQGGYEVDEAHRFTALWKLDPSAASILQQHARQLWQRSEQEMIA